MGDIPVIARLVYSDGTEVWQPARANRWTQSQVLVLWLSDHSSPLSTQLCWLSTSDVTRMITGSTGVLSGTWAQLRRGQTEGGATPPAGSPSS